MFSQVTIFQIEDGKTKVGEKKLREFLGKEKIDISHIRCIIVGCARAGKTTFLRRLENTPFAKLKNEVKSTEMADIYVNMFEVSEDRETIESKLVGLKWKKKSMIFHVMKNNGILITFFVQNFIMKCLFLL